MILVAVTLVVLLGLSRIPTKARAVNSWGLA
jgi:Sec-independent protein translocase protein TatA